MQRSAVSTSPAAASRARKPWAPALIASENSSLPPPHWTARTRAVGRAALISSIARNDAQSAGGGDDGPVAGNEQREVDDREEHAHCRAAVGGGVPREHSGPRRRVE